MRHFTWTCTSLTAVILIACGNSSTGPEGPDVDPSILVVEQTDTTEVTAVWSVCEDDAFKSYVLYRSTSPGIMSDPGSAEVLGVFTDKDDNSYTDDVDINTWYYYAVQTIDKDDFYVWSNEDSVCIAALPDVEDLAIDPQSSGRNIMLTWSDIPDADGYCVYFKHSPASMWIEVGNVTASDFVHTATVAGYYSVRAYSGSDYSLHYSNVVNTLPFDITTIFTIFDNYCSAGNPSGFIFGYSSGQTGNAQDPSFMQDIYAYDDSKGDYEVSVYSGACGPFGNGNQTFICRSTYVSFCEEYGTGSWSEQINLDTEDRRVFLYLSTGEYVKMYNLTLTASGHPTNGTSVNFSYEIQTGGLTVFSMK